MAPQRSKPCRSSSPRQLASRRRNWLHLQRPARAGCGAISRPMLVLPGLCDLPRRAARKGHADCSRVGTVRHPGSDGQTPSSPPRDASSIIHHGDFDFPQGHSFSHPLAALPARHRAAASDRRLARGAVGRARRDSRRPRGDARVAAAGARSPPRRHLSRRSRSARSVQRRRGRRTRALARFPSRLGSSAMRTFASTKVLGHLEHPEPTFQLDLCNETKNFPLWRRCRTRSRVVPTHDTGVSPPYRAKTCLHRGESC